MVISSPEIEIAVIIPPGAKLAGIKVDGETLRVPAPATDLAVKNSESNTQPMFFPPALIFVRSFSPGLHQITAGEASVQFFVQGSDGNGTPPGDWPTYTPHPPALTGNLTCVACHELTEQRRFSNMDGTYAHEPPSTCFHCHDREKFYADHVHRYETIAYCQICHDPHGGVRENLLKMSPQKACTLCHE